MIKSRVDDIIKGVTEALSDPLVVAVGAACDSPSQAAKKANELGLTTQQEKLAKKVAQLKKHSHTLFGEDFLTCLKEIWKEICDERKRRKMKVKVLILVDSWNHSLAEDLKETIMEMEDFDFQVKIQTCANEITPELFYKKIRDKITEDPVKLLIIDDQIVSNIGIDRDLVVQKLSQLNSKTMIVVIYSDKNVSRLEHNYILSKNFLPEKTRDEVRKMLSTIDTTDDKKSQKVPDETSQEPAGDSRKETKKTAKEKRRILIVDENEKWKEIISRRSKELDPECSISSISEENGYNKIPAEIEKNPIDILFISGQQVLEISYAWSNMIEEMNKLNNKEITIVIFSSWDEGKFTNIAKDHFFSKLKESHPLEILKKLAEIYGISEKPAISQAEKPQQVLKESLKESIGDSGKGGK